MTVTNIYIDAANLHIGSKEVGYKIDYEKFCIWLRQKYHSKKIYLFIGFLESNIELYDEFKKFGYSLIFKQTIYSKGKIKGNCDAELVLQVCNDFHLNSIRNFILITGDGDFACLVDFLQHSRCIVEILSPDKSKCSVLLKRTGVRISDIREHRNKFSKNKKASR